MAVPKGVTASVDGQTVSAKGPKGQLAVTLVDEVGVEPPPRRVQLHQPAEQVLLLGVEEVRTGARQ